MSDDKRCQRYRRTFTKMTKPSFHAWDETTTQTAQARVLQGNKHQLARTLRVTSRQVKPRTPPCGAIRRLGKQLRRGSLRRRPRSAVYAISIGRPCSGLRYAVPRFSPTIGRTQKIHSSSTCHVTLPGHSLARSTSHAGALKTATASARHGFSVSQKTARASQITTAR
jgi:hypothetical protein